MDTGESVCCVNDLVPIVSTNFIELPTMKNCVAFAVIVLSSQVFWIDGAPNALDSTIFKNLSEPIEIDRPVRYDGAQLWNVDFNDDRTKTIVVELKRAYGEFI